MSTYYNLEKFKIKIVKKIILLSSSTILA